MKNLKHFVLTMLVALVSATSASAADFEVDGIYFTVISREDLTCEVTSGDNIYQGDIIIPSTVFFSGLNFAVIRIGSDAFSSSKITSIKIPNNIEILGNPFKRCLDLTN